MHMLCSSSRYIQARSRLREVFILRSETGFPLEGLFSAPRGPFRDRRALRARRARKKPSKGNHDLKRKRKTSPIDVHAPSSHGVAKLTWTQKISAALMTASAWSSCCFLRFSAGVSLEDEEAADPEAVDAASATKDMAADALPAGMMAIW